MIDVLVASYLEPEHVARIADVPGVRVHFRPDLVPPPRFVADHTGAPFARDDAAEAAWRALLARAEVAFDFDYVRPQNFAEHAPRLRWVQASSAGIGQLVARTGLADTALTFTTAAGVHGRPLAEFVLWAILGVAKRYPLARAQQRSHVWQRFHGGEIDGSTLLMVGLGGIGRSVAALLRPLGVRVVGTKRDTAGATPHSLGVDALVPWRELDDALPAADHVVLACPLTPETAGLIDERRLARFREGASLVNVGRGGLVDHDALLAALDAGRLAAAVLDVTDPEPLPAGHRLWDHERVIVFPHSASTSVRENARLVELFLDNLDRYRSGRPLRNVFRRELGY